ncbi:MAG: ABC transporter permease [Candidatus Omnitrophica bacterium]|nr:ABC transporter permease [Candidatus Omnitrophota bacterium]
MRAIISTLARIAGGLGHRFIDIVRYAGGVSILMVQTLFWIPIPPLRTRQTIEQMSKIGVDSFPIVSMISMFTGMVLALQSAYQLQRFAAEMYIASLVAFSMTRELAPVLTALIVAGRVGASITAELGTMKVTEQIDALETLATNPVKYLVVPRFLALVIMVPILTLYADLIGIMGGYLIGVYKLGISHAMYMKNTWDPLKYKDIWTGLIKSVVFAVIVCIVACYEGMTTEGGAEGVGRSTTASVVTSFILIIASDCFLTALFYFIGR